ncbi:MULTISPECIES: hypothetical protein [unclassified Enterobacter]|uniref:hypothetical protein n=1 Tax=unclassified Enterobacter TaxID=2608935 RepID=UPI00160E339D|nr:MULTISPECIES: hypothetical protein [unclassified Enterobacter]
MKMVVTGHVSPAKQVCQPCDKPKKAKKTPITAIPQEWTLTSQQQGFIEMFMEDDVKKQ